MLCFLLIFALGLTAADYDAVRKIEHARLYGNVDQYAYFFVDLVVGTPPQRVSVILDTGSGVCAYPCASCKHCGHHIDPAYDIGKSSTAHWLQCVGNRCPIGRCSSGKCSYYQGYTEGSSISGFWFEDMVSLGDMIQHNPQVKARMGCHSNENNLFYTQKANGIMGIGPSALDREAILDKIFKDRAHVSHKIFSICLAEWGGQFNVGGYDDSYHTGPMQRIRLNPGSFYGVGLSSMEVGGVRISNFGSTMIDSGTTYTYMKSSNYKKLVEGVTKSCGGNKCGGSAHGRNCWKLPNGPSKFPSISVFFGSVETKWVPEAYFYRKGRSDTYCYGFEDDGPHANTVLGAVWMMHQEIVFDLEKKEVGIAPAKCPEHKDRPAHVQAAQVAPTASPAAPSTASTSPSTSPSMSPSTSASPSTSQSIPTSSPNTSPSTTPSTSASTSASTTASTSATSESSSGNAIAGQATFESTPTVVATTTEGSQAPSTVTRIQVQTPQEPEREPLSVLQDFGGFLKRHPLQLMGALAAGVLVAWLVLCLFKRLCLKREQHRHVQLKEEDESGMPPQIVGAEGGFDAFVIGDDEAEHLEEGFSYAEREAEWDLGGGLGLQRREKEVAKENGEAMDLMDS